MVSKSRKHIHIVGCSPRSGTTLLQEMMVPCFRIDHYCEHERSLFKEAPYPEGIACTKQPREVMYAELAMRVDPDLYFIYMQRDPRDVCVSSHGNRPGAYYTDLGLYLRASQYANAIDGHPRFIRIRYEDLVRHPDAVQQALMQRLPFLEYRHPFSEYYQHARVSDQSLKAMHNLRPPDTRSIGKWKNHLERVAEQVAAFPAVLDEIRRHGYEPDDRWLEQLPTLSSSAPTSGKAPDFSSLKDLRLRWRTVRKVFHYWRKLRK
ncbi:hypothetical protein MASR1M60_00650 [Rhodocyclaceae bacterium]